MNIYNFSYKSCEIKMDLPYENDYIMKYIIKNKTFWEDWILSKLDYYLKGDRSLCLDIGSNIGNHSIYFSKILGYKSVYSFEPQVNIFEILKTNITLNECNGKIIPYNVGLYSEQGLFKIKKRVKDNCGCVSFEKDDNGDFEFHTLDEYDFHDVSLLKMDVEGLQYNVLCGSETFFKNNKPFIWLEMNCYERDSYKSYNEFVRPVNFLLDKGYKLIRKFKCSDYFFTQ